MIAAPASRWTTGGMAISLGLHALLILPLVVVGLRAPRHVDRQMLTIELSGLMSNRQVEQRTLGEKVSQLSPRPRPRQVVERKQVTALTQSTAESPVQVARQEEHKEQPQEDQPVQPAAKGAEVQQVQQTLQAESRQSQELRYVAALSKAVQAKAIVPLEARRSRQTGSPEVSFGIGAEGQLVAASLTVHKTSGYPLLDAAALEAVRNAAPFARPPRPMTAVMEIPFRADIEKK
jgi:TonB family protein